MPAAHGAELLRQQQQRDLPGGNRRPVRQPLRHRWHLHQLCDLHQRWLSTPSPLFQGGTTGANTDQYKPYVIDPVNTFESWDTSINLNWQLSDNVSLLWVSSYRDLQELICRRHRRLADRDPTAAASDGPRAERPMRSGSIPTVGERIDLTFGAFYLDQDTAEDARVDLPYVGFDFIHGPDLVPSNNQALYAHAAFQLTDRMNLSLGVRYSEDEKSYTFRRRNPDLTAITGCAVPLHSDSLPWFWEAGNPANCGVFGLDLLSVEYSSDNTDYRARFPYDVGDSSMIYGQVATGYKAGGNNARPFFPSQLNAFEPGNAR